MNAPFKVDQLPTNIFNLQKNDYDVPEIILGQQPGLFDSINNHFPAPWKIYKRLRKLDWDEHEVDFGPCNAEFKSCDPDIRDIMIETLAWQWEADSIAARSIVGILAPVITDSRIWQAYLRINENEGVHALTYSEIVRVSFDNPDEIRAAVLAVEEAQSRMSAVANIMATAYTASHEYALGIRQNDQSMYNDIFMYFIALYFLERIQFMASFAITFAIGKAGNFQPISDVVKKIAQDEFEIHSQYGQEIIRILLQSERGKLAYIQCKQRILGLAKEILWTETTWAKYIFRNNRELVGVNIPKLVNWVQFNGLAAFTFLGIQDDVVSLCQEDYEKEFNLPLAMPKVNPIPFLQDYLDIAGSQASPQEQSQTAYMVNLMDAAGEQEVFDM
jgi:ribonucleoside-diphosphate reductase beta chain